MSPASLIPRSVQEAALLTWYNTNQRFRQRAVRTWNIKNDPSVIFIIALNSSKWVKDQML